MNRVTFGRHSVKLPGNRPLRMSLGLVLVFAGLLGFLPVVGFWMIPLGLAVLAVDIPVLDRWWSRMQPRFEGWLARRFPVFWSRFFAELEE